MKIMFYEEARKEGVRKGGRRTINNDERMCRIMVILKILMTVMMIVM